MLRTITILICIGLALAGPLAQDTKTAPPPAPPADDPSKSWVMVDAAQPPPANLKAGFDAISEREISPCLRFLSIDGLEGRETASRGYDTAAEFAAAQLALWGVAPAGPAGLTPPAGPAATAGKPDDPGYFQEVPIREITASGSQVVVTWASGDQIRSRTFAADLDYLIGPVWRTEAISAPVVFAGYGIREEKAGWNEYQGLDVKGKIVLVLTEAPRRDDPASPFRQGELKDKYFPRRPARHALSPKAALARELGAAAVLQVENSPEDNPDVARKALDAAGKDDSKPIIPGLERRMTLPEPATPAPWETIPVLTVSREMADAILAGAGFDLSSLRDKINKEFQPASRELPGVTLRLETTAAARLVRSRNVLAWVEGSDPVLKGEVVVLGAHLDHLGMRGDYIFNGADDNGSGAAALMAIARACTLNPVKPKRSLLFALWTGEEQGLLGSRYYASHPRFPLTKTVACLNLDMIGTPWTDKSLRQVAGMWGVTVPEEMKPKLRLDDFLILSHAGSAELAEAIRTADQAVGLQLYLRESRTMMGGSDHAPFAQRGIPWVFFFASMNEDYHQPGDSLEKVSLPLVQKIARLAYLTAFTMADR